MIDKNQILKIAQENKLDYDFVELYVEEIEKIFHKNFCFTEKEIQKHITKIFETQSQEAVEYFFNIFHNFSLLNASSKELNDTEKMYRKKFAQDAVEKAFELYSIQSKKIKDEFFAALKEAEKYGIDPYRISNKTTFKNLTKESFLESLKALMEDTYVDTNTMNEFRLFENTEDVKAMFEECSSLACKFNSDAIQNVLELLSNFTYDQENGVFFGKVNYVNMVRKCKKILTQSPAKLQETMDFLLEYFTDKNDPATKQELILKVNQDPTILLLSPNKVFSLEKELVSVGMSAEKAKAFCFNKNNLIQINGISKENIENLKTLKTVLHQYLDDESTLDALTRFEIIKTKPIVLDIIFKRAIEEGVYSNLLKRPSALAMIVGEKPNFNPKTRESLGDKRERNKSFKPLDEAKTLSAEEKALLQKELLKISSKDKEYIENVIEKLKGKERDTGNTSPSNPSNRDSQNKANGSKKRKSKYIDDQLVEKIKEIESNENLSDELKVLSIAELCLDKIKGYGYCKKTFCSDEVKRNLERLQELNCLTRDLVNCEIFQPFEKIITHLEHLAKDSCPFYDGMSKMFEDYYAPKPFKENFALACSLGEKAEKAANLTVKIGNYNDRIIDSIVGTSKTKKGKRAVYSYRQLFFHEGNLNTSVINMLDELHKVLKKDIEEVLPQDLVKSILFKKFDPTLPMAMFDVYKEINKLSQVERATLDSDTSMQDMILNHNALRHTLTDSINHDPSFLRHKAVLYCQMHMRDTKTGNHKLDKKLDPDIFKIQSMEYDEEGIYLRFKKGYTLFYPGAPTQQIVDKFRLKEVEEGTKSLPKVTMTQDKMFDDLDKFENKIFS